MSETIYPTDLFGEQCSRFCTHAKTGRMPAALTLVPIIQLAFQPFRMMISFANIPFRRRKTGRFHIKHQPGGEDCDLFWGRAFAAIDVVLERYSRREFRLRRRQQALNQIGVDETGFEACNSNIAMAPFCLSRAAQGFRRRLRNGICCGADPYICARI